MTDGSEIAEPGALVFSRQVAITLAAKIAVAGSSLLAGIIVARWLGAASVGIVGSLVVLTVLAINFGGFGISSAITLLVARDRAKVPGILGSAVITAFTSGGILTSVVVVLALEQPTFFGEVPSQLVIITAVAIPFQMLYSFCLAILLGRGEIGRYNLFDMMAPIFFVINPMVAIILLGYGLFVLVTLNAGVNIVISLLLLFLIFQELRRDRESVQFKIQPALIREMFGYGSRFFVAMAAAVVILRSDLLIVNYFRGSTEAGVYAVSTQVGTLLLLLPNVISTLLFPRVTKTRDETGSMTCRVVRHTVVIMIVVCLAAIPLSFVLPLFYGPAFAAIPIQVMILLPGVAVLGILSVQVQYFSSLGLPRIIPVYWVVTMIISILFDIFLIPSFGAYAAAAISSLSYALVFFLVALTFRRRTGKTLRETFLISVPEFRGLLNFGRKRSNSVA
jgi:O-antigen/teichoic acid export membrane protein